MWLVYCQLGTRIRMLALSWLQCGVSFSAVTLPPALAASINLNPAVQLDRPRRRVNISFFFRNCDLKPKLGRSSLRCKGPLQAYPSSQLATAERHWKQGSGGNLNVNSELD